MKKNKKRMDLCFIRMKVHQIFEDEYTISDIHKPRLSVGYRPQGVKNSQTNNGICKFSVFLLPVHFKMKKLNKK